MPALVFHPDSGGGGGTAVPPTPDPRRPEDVKSIKERLTQFKQDREPFAALGLTRGEIVDSSQIARLALGARRLLQAAEGEDGPSVKLLRSAIQEATAIVDQGAGLINMTDELRKWNASNRDALQKGLSGCGGPDRLREVIRREQGYVEAGTSKLFTLDELRTARELLNIFEDVGQNLDRVQDFKELHEAIREWGAPDSTLTIEEKFQMRLDVDTNEREKNLPRAKGAEAYFNRVLDALEQFAEIFPNALPQSEREQLAARFTDLRDHATELIKTLEAGRTTKTAVEVSEIIREEEAKAAKSRPQALSGWERWYRVRQWIGGITALAVPPLVYAKTYDVVVSLFGSGEGPHNFMIGWETLPRGGMVPAMAGLGAGLMWGALASPRKALRNVLAHEIVDRAEAIRQAVRDEQGIFDTALDMFKTWGYRIGLKDVTDRMINDIQKTVEKARNKDLGDDYEATEIRAAEKAFIEELKHIKAITPYPSYSLKVIWGKLWSGERYNTPTQDLGKLFFRAAAGILYKAAYNLRNETQLPESERARAGYFLANEIQDLLKDRDFLDLMYRHERRRAATLQEYAVVSTFAAAGGTLVQVMAYMLTK